MKKKVLKEILEKVRELQEEARRTIENKEVDDGWRIFATGEKLAYSEVIKLIEEYLKEEDK